MKIPIKSMWSTIIQAVIGASIPCAGGLYLLLFTSMGDGMPIWAAYGISAGSWIGILAFFFSHLTPDRKAVDFKIF